MLCTLQVTDGGFQVYALNELEYVNGEIWANIWLTDCIARIDPATGTVKCASLTHDQQLTSVKHFGQALPQKCYMQSLCCMQGVDPDVTAAHRAASSEHPADLPNGCPQRCPSVLGSNHPSHPVASHGLSICSVVPSDLKWQHRCMQVPYFGGKML